jgi:Tol biopolymer transport system component
VAYAARNGEKRFVVLDGQKGEGAEYNRIGEGTLIFSPDSKRVVYVAEKGDKLAAEKGDKLKADKGDKLVAEKGDKLVAEKGDKLVVVADGLAGAEYDGIGPLSFSPDGKRVAYVAMKGEKSLVVVDGQPGAEYDGIGTLSFSPDGKRIAYGAKKDEKWLVVVDGHAGAQYDGIGNGSPIFSPKGVLEYLAIKEGSLYRVKYIPTL